MGHPNPRRVALHDNFPERSIPLRKDFDLFSRAPILARSPSCVPPCRGRRRSFELPVGRFTPALLSLGHFRLICCWRANIVPANPFILYPQGHPEKLFPNISRSRRQSSSARDLRRLQLQPYHRFLSGDREPGRVEVTAPRSANPNGYCSNSKGCTTTLLMWAPLPRM